MPLLESGFRRFRALFPALLLVTFGGACSTVGDGSGFPRAVSASKPALADMSVDEKIGQLFVYSSTARFMNEGSPEYAALVHQVRDNHVGGVMWFLLSDVYETAFLNRKLQALARTPLLISADLEAGPGMRFRDTTYWPWPMAVAATGDPALAEREGAIVGEEARALGLNQIYAPVADVNSDPENPVINVRSFGEDPQDVARYVAAFVRGVQSRGVLATAKHFPGHGSTRTDSHRSLPVLQATREQIEATELVPFRAAIAAGVASVMTAHLSIPSLDASPAPVRREGKEDNPYTKDVLEVAQGASVPASLSAPITEGLLRGELGFRGLVVTDALDMGGIQDHFDAGEAAVRAVLAGADQLPKSQNIDAAIAGVRAAVASGRISLARLDASVARILAAKVRAGNPAPDPERIFQVLDSPAHRAAVEEIARRSVTLVREETGALPLARAMRIAHIIVTDQARFADEISDELKTRLAEPPSVFRIDPLSSEADVAAALAGAAASDRVVLSLFARFQSGKGSISLPALGRSAIESLLRPASPSRPSAVVIVFGSPYILRDAAAARTAIVAWGSQSDLQTAAVRALFGEAAIGGRLPVTIPGVAARGAGIVRAATVASSKENPVR